MPYKNKEDISNYNKRYRANNLEKVRERERKSANKNKHKRADYWKHYSSIPENIEKIKEYKKQYESLPEKIEAKRKRSSNGYLKNKDKILARQSERRKQRMKIMAEVSLHYGCKNPNCLWKGDFSSYQLDFHHLDPSTKTTEVAKLESSSYERIQNEINKCVVLCRNCHAEVHHGSFVPIESMLCNIVIKEGNVRFA